jgi:hypothetical protein
MEQWKTLWKRLANAAVSCNATLKPASCFGASFFPVCSCKYVGYAID